MKKVFTIILVFNIQWAIFPVQCFSQTAPGIVWQNTIGGNDGEANPKVQQTFDGGYMIGCSSESNISGDKTENSNGSYDIWMVKLDAAGAIQWQNTIGGAAYESLGNFEQTADSGYILAAASYSDISGDKTENSLGGMDYWVIKLDAAGTIQWQNTIGGSDDDALLCIHQTADGGYILGGYSKSGVSSDKTEMSQGSFDYWVMKLDATGAIQWQNTIGGNNWDELLSLEKTSDGGYIAGGQSLSDLSGDKTENSLGDWDYWVMKLDSAGAIQWENTIGGSARDALWSVKQTVDGGYILGGESSSDSSGDKTENCLGIDDYWIIKLNASGTIQWQNTIGGSDADALLTIAQTADEGYIIGGYSLSDISGDKTENAVGMIDYWPVKLDSTGTISWQNTLGGTDNDVLISASQTADGGYILSGWSGSDISGDKTEIAFGGGDYWIIKLGPDTTTGISPTPAQLGGQGVAITPNPLTTTCKISFSNPAKENFLFTLYDITGRVTESVSTVNNEISLTKGSKQAGVYFFNLMNEKTEERWNGKVLISN